MESEELEDVTTEERLLREENIPGLAIRGQDHELLVLQHLQKHFEALNSNNLAASDDEDKNKYCKKVNILPSHGVEETDSEKKIRLGEMTPFGSVLNATNESIEVKENRVRKYLEQQEIVRQTNRHCIIAASRVSSTNKHKIRQKTRRTVPLGTKIVEEHTSRNAGRILSEQISIDFDESSGSEYVPSSLDDSEDETCTNRKKLDFHSNSNKKQPANTCSDEYSSDSDTTRSSNSNRIKVLKEIDDGNEEEYERRLKQYEKSCDTTQKIFHDVEGSNFKIPLETWSKLYNYQKVGVQWLWELDQQGAGGILADEMGLGKTIQVISFLSGLYYSKFRDKHTSFVGLGPVLIICPTTLMHQWVKEIHIWHPLLRVAVLHACGSFAGKKQYLIRDLYRGKGVLITSYPSMVKYSDEILRYSWHYVILDEGHKIRNPDAKITLAVKQVKTPHRLILSGSPLQNNLEELWSLFDFVFPGKLGAMPLFQAQFAVPITHGGYANASDIEVTIAYKCATVLKELISPYLLRRSKADVKSHINLPEKNEQVLFCQLTDCQKELYKSYVDSKEVNQILEGQAQIFVGIINLRKICNHPDLFTGGLKLLINENEEDKKVEDRFGYWEKSGKMIVLRTLLRIWHKQNHKVLLFSQSRKMLDILERFINSCKYTYLKLDGGTNIGSRQPLIDKFNSDSSYFIMLLTTKVGGLGINLTGANRIVIFDPDWNPATDTQARERAWRIGQTQDVTIYRLISAGTIEEKMYHRQIFKQFLTNKVLKDPKQRRFFKSNDLFELFMFKESNVDGSTETGAIFAGTGSEINKKILKMKKRRKKKKLGKELGKKTCIQFSPSKIEKMREIAHKISRKLSNNSPTNSLNTESAIVANLCASNTCNKADAEPSCSFSKTPNLSMNNDDTKISKRKCKKSLFEGEQVPYLVKSKRSKVPKNDSIDEPEMKAVEDEYVLKKLFSKAGICSALQHDTIMEGGPADYAIIEKEAERIAQQAIDELKHSQEQCFPATSGIPNWTGKSGIRTKMKTDSKVLSSSQILDKIRQRTGEIEATSSEIRILKDLKQFLHSHGGTCSTDKLIEKFQSQLPASATPLFKTLLNKTCTFYRGPDKRGYWTLKDEFR